MTYTRIYIYTCRANSVYVHILTYTLNVRPNLRPYIDTHIASIVGGVLFSRRRDQNSGRPQNAASTSQLAPFAANGWRVKGRAASTSQLAPFAANGV